MLTTIELRWFDRGTLPEAMIDWFKSADLGDQLGEPEERQDLYLYSVGCEGLNIKLRQGKLEIKWRQAELTQLSFSDQLEGKAEKWIKWSWEDSTAQNQIPKELVGNPWVNVTKVRSQRLYQVLPDQSVTAVPITESIDSGCTVELTQLRVLNQDWWSLAFEASGDDTQLMENLQAVVSWVFQTYPGSKLPVEDSFAYPSWLSRVVCPSI